MQLCLLPQSFASPWHAFFCAALCLQAMECCPALSWQGQGKGETLQGVCFNAHAIIRKQGKLRIACLGRLRAGDKQETWRNICLMVKRERNKAKIFGA